MATEATITPNDGNLQESKLTWGLGSMNSWEADFQGHCFNLVSLNSGGYKVRHFFDQSWETLQFYRKPTALADWNIVAETSGTLSVAKGLAEMVLKTILDTPALKDRPWQFFATPDECYDILVGYDDLTDQIEVLKKQRDELYGLSRLRLQQRCSQRKLQAIRKTAEPSQ